MGDEPEDLNAKEQALRIEQMTVNIEKMRLEMRQEQRKIAIQTVAALGTAAAGGAALLVIILHLTGKL